MFTSTATYRKTDYFFGEALRKRTSRPKKCTNLNAFGWTLPGRNGGSNYRYAGAGGQEQDNEVYGSKATSYTTQHWMYSSRLGRRWEKDPITYPWHGSYSVFNNNPIVFTDNNGLYGTKEKADKKREKAVKRYGEDRVGDVYKGKNDQYAYTLYKKGQNKYTTTKQLADGGIQISEYKGTAIYGSGDLIAVNGGAAMSQESWSFVNWLRGIDRKMLGKGANHDGHTDRPPVQTDFHGFIPMGDGPTINEHMYGDPHWSDDSGINPGELLIQINTQSLKKFGKDIDDWDDLFDADGGEFFNHLSNLSEPVLSMVTDMATELISKKTNSAAHDYVVKEDGSTGIKYFTNPATGDTSFTSQKQSDTLINGSNVIRPLIIKNWNR